MTDTPEILCIDCMRYHAAPRCGWKLDAPCRKCGASVGLPREGCDPEYCRACCGVA